MFLSAMRGSEILSNIFDSSNYDYTVKKVKFPYLFNSHNNQQMNVDIIESNEEFILHVELPGVKLEDISINIESDILTIKAKKTEVFDEENICHQEINYNELERSFKLNKNDSEKIEASLKNGMLTITIPKLEETKSKNVKIKSS